MRGKYSCVGDTHQDCDATDLGEVDKIAERAAPVQNDVLSGVVLIGIVSCAAVGSLGSGKFDKSATFADKDVTGSDCCSGFLNRRIINEKVLAIATGTQDGY